MSSFRVALIISVIWVVLIMGGTYFLTGFRDDPRTNDIDGQAGFLAGIGLGGIPMIGLAADIARKKREKQKDK